MSEIEQVEYVRAFLAADKPLWKIMIHTYDPGMKVVFRIVGPKTTSLVFDLADNWDMQAYTVADGMHDDVTAVLGRKALKWLNAITA